MAAKLWSKSTRIYASICLMLAIVLVLVLLCPVHLKNFTLLKCKHLFSNPPSLLHRGKSAGPYWQTLERGVARGSKGSVSHSVQPTGNSKGFQLSSPSKSLRQHRESLLLVNRKGGRPSRFPEGMNTEGNVSATCRGDVLYLSSCLKNSPIMWKCQLLSLPDFE